MFQKAIRLFHTLKYLRPRQLFYQAYYRITSKVSGNRSYHEAPDPAKLDWQSPIQARMGWFQDNSFEFLNQTRQFQNIDWNFDGYGKLWTYNLNYFDYLNQPNMTREEGLGLIHDFMQKEEGLKDALEPYPISLRGINWIKFLSRHGITDPEINTCLYSHYQRLYGNLEYHLMGNHLLENGFSLLFAGVFFKDEKFLKRASKIIEVELKEQILADGAHFELSPMYHQIILHRLLDGINLLRLNEPGSEGLLTLLQSRASAMLGWLESVTFSDGNVPMVNDSAFGIAPGSRELFTYATELGITWKAARLKESGYRKWANGLYECFMDLGDIGPDYIPGHAHADTFNFELYVKGHPFIVDLGTSTYEKDEKRQQERGTASHNTVLVNHADQSEVWGGFRVARRAKIIERDEGENRFGAAHDGYKRMGVIHQRTFFFEDTVFHIEDTLKGNAASSAALFHFHPAIKDLLVHDDGIRSEKMGVVMKFDGDSIELDKSEYAYATGFNTSETGIVVRVSFNRKLFSSIVIKG